jgi:hypothetical protein
VRIAVRIFTNYPDPNFQTLPSLQPSDYSLNPHKVDRYSGTPFGMYDAI